ncbi:MAG: hypothetical protein ACE37D_20415 [Pseudomonadales bacterium]
MKPYRIFVCLPFLVGLLTAQAENGEIKSWYYDTAGGTDGSGINLAATYPENGKFSFGQYCFLGSGNCLYITDLEISCEEGAEYPGIVNSHVAAVPIKLTCYFLGEQPAFTVAPFDDMDNVVRQAERMSIVVPLANDDYKVVRFSLGGSTYALDLMRAASLAYLEEKDTTETKPTEEIL